MLVSFADISMNRKISLIINNIKPPGFSVIKVVILC